jgi:hypothetical protein
MIMFSFFEMLYSSLETGRQAGFGGEAANPEEEKNRTVTRTAIDALSGSAI